MSETHLKILGSFIMGILFGIPVSMVAAWAGPFWGIVTMIACMLAFIFLWEKYYKGNSE